MVRVNGMLDGAKYRTILEANNLKAEKGQYLYTYSQNYNEAVKFKAGSYVRMT